MQTDAKGSYSSSALSAGTYKVSVIENGACQIQRHYPNGWQ